MIWFVCTIFIFACFTNQSGQVCFFYQILWVIWEREKWKKVILICFFPSTFFHHYISFPHHQIDIIYGTMDWKTPLSSRPPSSVILITYSYWQKIFYLWIHFFSYALNSYIHISQIKKNRINSSVWIFSFPEYPIFRKQIYRKFVYW